MYTYQLVWIQEKNWFCNACRIFQFGVIYAGAQKNIGCAGVTIVIG